MHSPATSLAQWSAPLPPPQQQTAVRNARVSSPFLRMGPRMPVQAWWALSMLQRLQMLPAHISAMPQLSQSLLNRGRHLPALCTPVLHAASPPSGGIQIPSCMQLWLINCVPRRQQQVQLLELLLLRRRLLGWHSQRRHLPDEEPGQQLLPQVQLCCCQHVCVVLLPA